MAKKLANTKYKSILLLNFQDRIKEVFNKPQNSRKFINEISSYIDKNNEILNYNTPSYKLTYDPQFIYDITGITNDEVISATKNIKYRAGMSSGNVAKNPLYILLTLILRNFEISHNQNGERYTLMYMTLVIYSVLFSKYYKFEPNDSIMQYTINRINNRFYFKQYGTVFKATYAISEQNNQKNKNVLKRDDDMAIIDYIISLYSRLNNQMRSFSIEFYKDQKSKNYLNVSKEEKDEDGNDYSIPENISYTVETVSQKTIDSFFQTRINRSLSDLSANMSNVSSTTVFQILNDIRSNEINKVVKLIKDTIAVYLNDRNNTSKTIGSRKFIVYSLKIYTRNNITDEAIIEIKKILNYLLKTYSNKYNQTDREATKSNYRKAVFMYYVFLISKNS